MNREMSKLIRAFSKLTNKSYRAIKKEFYKLSDQDKFKSKMDLKKIYKDNMTNGTLTKNYYDLKKPLTKKDSSET